MRLLYKDLLRYLPGDAGLAVLGLVAIPVLTRILSPEQFGTYVLVMSSVGVVVLLFGSFPMGIIRFYPAVSDGERGVLVRTSVWTQVFSVVGAGSVFLILTWMLWPSDSSFRWLAVAGTAIIAAQTIFQILLQVLCASLRVEAFNLYRIWCKAAGLALGVVLALVFDLGVFGLLWGIVLGFITALPFLWRKVFAGFSSIGRLSKIFARELGGFGFPLVVGNVAAWVLSQFDRYFIQYYFGALEVGLYSAAYTISEHSVTMLATFFMISSTPLMTQVWEKQGEHATRQVFISVTRSYLLLGIPAVFGLSVLAEPTMKVLTGAEFAAGYSIVPWVVAGAFFIGLQHRFNQALKLVRRTWDIMFWILLSAALNILLNWWLLPWFGYTFAAVNTLICYVFLCLGQAWASRRHFCWPFPWLTMLRSGLAATFMAGGILILCAKIDASPLALLCFAIPLGMAIYAVSLYVLGEISTADLRMFQLTKKQRAPVNQPDYGGVD
jgi:O-antigen/teichoic acid export membrane protein